MLIIAGTIPTKDMPLLAGTVGWQGENLVVDNQVISPIQGTGAMISAALAATEYLGTEPPFIAVAGDIGRGDGTRLMYRYLTENVSTLKPGVLALHYCQPFMSMLIQLVRVIGAMPCKPVMVADAGAMYAAKAAGLAGQFDVFTPDPSEIAFLADEKATHPAYICHHLFNSGLENVPQLIKTAYQNKSAAKTMVVKGARDYIVRDGDILQVVDAPDVPVLEAIGGTGDTITGLTSAIIHAGYDAVEAGLMAARINRLAGKLVEPTPATRVSRLIDAFPSVFSQVLSQQVATGAIRTSGDK